MIHKTDYSYNDEQESIVNEESILHSIMNLLE